VPIDRELLSRAMLKPGDFFLGVTVLFAVLLPGAVVTFFLIPYRDLVLSSRSLPGGDAGAWIAFAVVSYLLGQVVYIVGSLLSEPFEDAWERLPIYLRPNTTRSLAELRSEVQPILDKLRLGSRHALSVREFVRIESPNAFVGSERLESEYKLFRSLAVVLVIAATAVHAWPASAIHLVLAVTAWWLFLNRRVQRLEADFRSFLILQLP